MATEVCNPELIAWSRPGLNLLNDFETLLSFYGHIDIHHANTLPHDFDANKWAVKFYEKHAAHWQQRIGHLMFEFEQFLRKHWL